MGLKDNPNITLMQVGFSNHPSSYVCLVKI